MECSKCGERRKGEFYKSSVKRNYGLCKKCTKLCISERRKFLKLKAIEYKGGCCKECGYCKNNASLDFHHLRDKEYAVGNLIRKVPKWDKLKEELDKCILLCANCHRELHYPKVCSSDFEFEHSLESRNGTFRSNRERVKHVEKCCKSCGKHFSRKPRSDRVPKYCSVKCKNNDQRKINCHGDNTHC
jgi:hypothetical protein